MYKIEIMMGKDCFTLQSEKAKMIPFFPLLSFADQNHEDYNLYHLQKRTYINVLERSRQNFMLAQLKLGRSSKKVAAKYQLLFNEFAEDLLQQNMTKMPTQKGSKASK